MHQPVAPGQIPFKSLTALKFHDLTKQNKIRARIHVFSVSKMFVATHPLSLFLYLPIEISCPSYNEVAGRHNEIGSSRESSVLPVVSMVKPNNSHLLLSFYYISFYVKNCNNK